MKLAPTPFAARQIVNHGHVLVNGKRVNIPSYKLSDGDTIELDVAGRELRVRSRFDDLSAGNSVALDGAMVLASMLLDLEPPRLAQGMAEKFINEVPFASEWSSRTGQFTGLPEHAERLLADERLLMVFPEGARGTAKLYWERHSLVGFGTGFVRLALATKTPIVPFAFLGGGEAIPTVRNLYRLGQLFGAPYIPVTPWLFPVPRRVPLDIYYSEPMLFTGSETEEDAVVERYVNQVKDRIAGLIASGAEART